MNGPLWNKYPLTLLKLLPKKELFGTTFQKSAFSGPRNWNKTTRHAAEVVPKSDFFWNKLNQSQQSCSNLPAFWVNAARIPPELFQTKLFAGTSSTNPDKSIPFSLHFGSNSMS